MNTVSEEARLIPSPPARVDNRKQNASASGAGGKVWKENELKELLK
jgi:hypothetical protein